MTETFTPAQVASILETDASTVRRWCGWHAAHLSDSASPSPGGRRLLTSHDVEVLREVRALRIAGLSTQAVNEQLANRIFAVPDSTELAQTSPDAPGHEITPVAMVNNLATLLGPIQARMEAIERNQRDRVTVFALGFLAACGLFGLILLLFVLFGQ